MQWVVEPSALDWVRERLDEFAAARVGSQVPSGFEAYARVLYPVGDGERTYRWSDVAAWSGKSLGPSSTFRDLSSRVGSGGEVERMPVGVHQGPPEPEVARVLTEVLAPATDGPCWFGVWEGYGWVWGGVLVMSTDPAVHGVKPTDDDLPVPAEVRAGERAWVPGRSYVLYTGTLDDALALDSPEIRWTHGDVPDLWWPADRSWFLGADTDLTCAYLGGSRATIERVLADPRLETQVVDRADALS